VFATPNPSIFLNCPNEAPRLDWGTRPPQKANSAAAITTTRLWEQAVMATSESNTQSTELKALLNRFETYLYARCGVSTTTANLYIGVIRRAFPLLGSDPSPEDIEAYIAHLRKINVSASYISAICTALERFSRSLGRPIDLRRPRKRATTAPQPLTEAEMAIMLHCTKNLREKAMLALLAYTGLRNKEFCHLRIRDVDVPNGLIQVEEGKFNRQRVVGVAGECMTILMEYMRQQGGEPDDFLFTTHRHGYQLEQQDVRKMVRVVARRAGFKRRIWPHLLRHSLATALIDRGAHLLTVKDQLGHVYINSTMTYIHRSRKAHSADYRAHAPSYI
jgi:integrase/recombinase XerD